MRHIVVYLVPTLLLAILLVYYVKPLSHWLGRLIYSPVESVEKGDVVAEVQEVSGKVVVHRPPQTKPLSKGDKVYQL